MNWIHFGGRQKKKKNMLALLTSEVSLFNEGFYD